MEQFKLYLFIIAFFFNQSSIAQTLKLSGIKGSLNTYISMQVLEEAYAQLGLKVELVELPAERALYVSNSGRLDGEVFRIANIHSIYPNLVQIPTQINVLQGVTFVKQLDFQVQGWQSLAPYKVGVQVGVKFAERGTHRMRTYQLETNEQLFMMLDRGRIEVAVAAYANGVNTIKQLGLSGIRGLTPPLQSYPLFHYLHNKHQHLVSPLNDVLSKMQASGRIADIRRAYIEKLLSDP